MDKLKCAIYCRLSKDDGTLDDSSSIQTQKDALTKYAIDNNFEIFDIYCDDGFSGTNVERPAFKRMIKDIEMRKINIVLTKDLSRLSRNYLQAGYYMEDFFPSHKVRYIAVNDNYDSEREDNEFAPFKNIINEWYAKDISKKIKYAFTNMMKAGRIPGGDVPLFGYDYDENRKRVINPETSKIVELIFKKYIELQSSTKITRYLNENKIICPGYYNYLKYGTNPKRYANCSEEEKTRWTSRGVARILNCVDYTGTLCIGKTKNEKLGGKKGVPVNKEDWFIHENAHEAIVDKETFDLIQTIKHGHKNQSISPDENKFMNILFCKYCGHPMLFNRGHTRPAFYLCNNKECENRHQVYKNIIYDVTKNEIKMLKELILNNQTELINYAKDYSKNKGKKNNTDAKLLANLKAKAKQVDNYITKLFEASVDGKIPESTYNTMLSKYTAEKEQIEKQIAMLAPTNIDVNYEEYLNSFIKALKEYDEDNLSNEVLMAIFSKIEIEVEKTCHRGKAKKRIYFHYHKLTRLLEDFINDKQTKK